MKEKEIKMKDEMTVGFLFPLSYTDISPAID